MRTLRELLRLEENEPLDFSEIQTILGHRVRNLHVKFSDLESYKNKYTLADVLPPHVNAALLLLTARISSKVNRHWVTLMRHQNGSISFYDPLRLGPHLLSSYMNDNNYFATFIRKIRADVNTQKHQRNTSLIKTCALHACCRLIAFGTQDLSNSEYHGWITSINMPTDELVTLLTFVGHLSV